MCLILSASNHVNAEVRAQRFGPNTLPSAEPDLGAGEITRATDDWHPDDLCARSLMASFTRSFPTRPISTKT
jgi:hypothetical protein